MQQSLFRKYFSITSAVLLVGFAFLGVMMMSLTRNYLKSEKKALLTSSIDDISVLCGESITEFGANSKFIANQIGTMARTIDSDIFITDIYGNTVLCSDQQGRIDTDCRHKSTRVPQEFVDKAVKGRLEESSDLNGFYQRKHYVVATPITSSDGTTYGIVFATASTDSISEFSVAMFKIFLGSAVASLCISCIIIYLVTYRLVKPLKQMSVASKRMSEGDFSTQIHVTSNDEIGSLAASFNNMSQSLSSLESMRRSFVANISHDLRTPMTTISGFIDGILDGTIPSESQQKYLLIVSDEVKRLSRLVTTMLNLSRLDAGELNLKPLEFDFSEMIVKTVLPLEQMIEKKNIQISGLDSLKKTNVFADRDLMTQVIYNLTENAIKFTNENGNIDISLNSADNKVYFRIRNTGIGISENELPRIFDRFYKSDKSRSMDKNGTGLGLYIVKTIIDLHKGQITVRSAEGEYCEFEFWIPKNAND